MASMKLILILSVFAIHCKKIIGHGMVMDPVARASAWRKGFKTPQNVDDYVLWCGGFTVQQTQNDGKCGICGDDFALSQPRPNENGGEFGRGVIVKKYKSGQVVTIKVHLTANHRGHFYFAVCLLHTLKELETEDCFIPIKLSNGQDSYELKPGLTGDIFIDVALPKFLKCKHCVFRWQWVTGNNNGYCKDGTEKLGCGPQEEFRTCSDITIM